MKNPRRSVRGRQSAHKDISECSPTIHDLPDSCLAEIFSKTDSAIECREVFPLVCHRWRNMLRGPGKFWEAIALDFSQTRGNPNLVISSAAVNEWLGPRAAATTSLSLLGSQHPPRQHDFRGTAIRLPTIIAHMPKLLNLSVWACSDWAYKEMEGMGALSFSEHLIKLELLHVTERISAHRLSVLSSFKKLQVLTIADGHGVSAFRGCLADVPPAIAELTDLTHLTLNSRGIHSIPSSLSKLVKLEELDFSGCKTVVIPSCFSALVNLRALRMNENVSVLTEALRRMNLHQISSLELRDSALSCLPVTPAMLTGLETLDLSGNNFGQHLTFASRLVEGVSTPMLPSCHVLEKLSLHRGILEVLQLNRCMLSELPKEVACGSLGQLQVLGLVGNGLVDLPDTLTNLSSLRELDVRENSFPRVPQVLYEMNGLEVLNMEKCDYLEVSAWDPFKSLLDLPNIKRIDMRKGPTIYGFGTCPYQATSQKFLAALAAAFNEDENGQHNKPVFVY